MGAGVLVRGRVGVEEALVRGGREKTPDAIQTLGFEEALDGETGAGQGTVSGSQEECEDSVWVQAWRRWWPDTGSQLAGGSGVAGAGAPGSPFVSGLFLHSSLTRSRQCL